MNKNLTDKQKLNKARIEIDKIDSKLLPLIVKRSKMVNLALESKTKKSQIIDQKRIKSILTKVAKAAKSKSADPNLIKSIWKSMIWNFIDYEKKEFKKENKQLFIYYEVEASFPQTTRVSELQDYTFSILIYL